MNINQVLKVLWIAIAGAKDFVSFDPNATKDLEMVIVARRRQAYRRWETLARGSSHNHFVGQKAHEVAHLLGLDLQTKKGQAALALVEYIIDQTSESFCPIFPEEILRELGAAAA